ncbi:MAG: hypothetical protein F2704_04865 [Actinobacteria bacterium]|uniref:Unannotated protein n=1 Tax=freshwater metagenome TaxID=449393 RepID=A0A6J7DNT4_9ZZZZ|nr:hypothetical protein [Actinomycetota bacterium]MSX25203.1 hypothetical protein [Actinomycetota bacterium]MSY57579.1 hypothetical protein [Actinomycetota bacterium]MTB00879.1 hypothetical protein [Actinomycetota bacterium]
MSKAQVSAHLKKFGPDQKKILTDLRNHIASKLPKSEQIIKYGIPTFLIEDVPVIGFDGYKSHNSIFPNSGSFNSRLKKELEKYVQTKGSIHFEVGNNIPKALVNKILTERILQINDSYPKKTGEYLEFYTNGVLKSKGKFKAGSLHGEWKWFRKTGVIMRSGSFKNGEQTGTWITYDAKGKVYKRTIITTS